MIVNGIAAVVIAYLIGSISGAYVFTRLVAGKDIRKLGGGNAGARNVYRSVGLKAAVPTAIVDVGKGALAVVIAHRLVGLPPMQLLGTPQIFVLAAGLAAVAGHIWPIYLKFGGGNGLSAVIGVLAILMPRELLVALGLMVVFTVVTRNPVLSVNIGLLTVPVFAWFSEEPGQYVVYDVLRRLGNYCCSSLSCIDLPHARQAIYES